MPLPLLYNCAILWRCWHCVAWKVIVYKYCGALFISKSALQTASKRRRAESCHRRGPKTVLAQTAEIKKCHAIFIVLKHKIEIAGEKANPSILMYNFLCIWIRSYLPPKKYWREAMVMLLRHCLTFLVSVFLDCTACTFNICTKFYRNWNCYRMHRTNIKLCFIKIAHRKTYIQWLWLLACACLSLVACICNYFSPSACWQSKHANSLLFRGHVHFLRLSLKGLHIWWK